jgi:LysM domain
MPLTAAQVDQTTMQHAATPAFPNGSMYAGAYTLLFRIRRKSDSALLAEHRLVLMPQRFHKSTELRSSVYYTQGGPVSDTLAEGGVGMTFFSIQGHTGFGGIRSTNGGPMADRMATRAATPEAFAQTVSQVFAAVTTGQQVSQGGSLIDGAAAIKDFEETFLHYFAPTGQTDWGVTQTQDLQLEFFNTMAPTSEEDLEGQSGWVIHPHRSLVDIQQDASKPFLYNYSFQFAALRPLAEAVTDVFSDAMANPQGTGFQETLKQITQTVTDLTNGVNTIVDAFDQMVIQNVTGPVSTFILGCNDLGDALGNFMNSTAMKIQFPLYAQRQFSHVLDAPRHSVTTLAEAAKQLGAFLLAAADPRALSRTFAGEVLTAGSNDALTMRVNNEDPVTLHLGTQSSGAGIAATLQSQMRAQTPQAAANASGYRDFTATFADGQYTLASGTKLSDAGQVTVVVSPDPDFTQADASALLGLGLVNGGQEYAGSAYPAPALALLRGIEQACAHLQAFPDYFADQLEQQDAAVAALLPVGVQRPQIRGAQQLRQTRVTPGDSLQGIAARVGVPWETLALVNRLTYPYILEEPTTLTRGRLSSATLWTVTDSTQNWPALAYQGQRLDIVAGTGAGQSRRILQNTAMQLVLEQAWSVVPDDTSNYAIRSAQNPIVRTGSISSSTATSVTHSMLTLVPGSQQGRTLVLTSGPAAGDRRRIVANDETTYMLERAWDVLPTPGTLYLLLGPAPSTRRQKIVGDLLSVPHPSATAITPIRTRIHDVSAITGRHISVEDQLFGQDLLLDGATMSLLYDPALGDVRTTAGLLNLRQALIHYINLPLGELEYAPGIGSFIQQELGLAATLPLQIQVLASVQRTIKQDQRIARMGQSRLFTQGGSSLIVFTAIAINGSAVDRVTVR